jgi:tetratricopeptide (TPR) repeat protein/DNA replication protein DnaC
MEDYDDAVRTGFSALFQWHFRHGTRPGTVQKQGKPWTPKNLAYQLGGHESAVKNVRNWLHEKIPAALDPLERAFFGKELPGKADPYEKWRKDFRYAYSIAKEPRQTEAKRRPSGPQRLVETVDELVLDDPRKVGRRLSATVGPADSLVAKFEKDDFLERAADQEFLRRFLTSGGSNDVTRQFRWALLTGPAGAGKTRLAINFLDDAETQGFRVGFLDVDNLKQFDGSGWRPNRPTFLVIDYAAESPDPVARMLKGLIATVCKIGFEYPVRVLLLEREATGDWFKTIAPMDSKGAGVRGFCYRENEERWDYPLTPLSSDALLAIMRGRLREGGTDLSDELLLDILKRIDPPVDGDDQQSTPRPLFAAAAALKIADMMESGDGTSAVISELALSKLQRKDVLAWIIGRERTHFWIDGNALDRRTEKQQLWFHENLLVVTTIALDIPRQKYDDECPDASREYLPSRLTLDVDRFRRMTDSDPITSFKRLEPDILGEFFVLERLKSLPPRERQSLVDAGLSLGGDGSVVFLIRCAMDFREDWRNLGFLKPSIRGPAMKTFAQVAVGLSYLLYVGEFDDFDDVAAVISDAQDLADRHADPVLREHVALALVNKGLSLGTLERYDEEIAVYDDIVSRYGPASEPPLREPVAMALVNKGLSLGALGRNAEEIAVYDDIVSRYGPASEPAMRERVARALAAKGLTLGALGRNDEAIAVYDDIVSRYGAATEPALREHVAKALVNKGFNFGGLGRHDEVIAVHDDILSRYGLASEPALREQVADALANKGFSLGALGRDDEAIAVYDDIMSQYGAASEPAPRKLVAKALVNKGFSLRALGRNDEALAVYERHRERVRRSQRACPARVCRRSARQQGAQPRRAGTERRRDRRL